MERLPPRIGVPSELTVLTLRAAANDMEIVKISEDKEKYIPLLLVGDEEEPMIMRYLPRGELFVMREGETALCAAVVTDEGDGARRSSKTSPSRRSVSGAGTGAQ